MTNEQAGAYLHGQAVIDMKADFFVGKYMETGLIIIEMGLNIQVYGDMENVYKDWLYSYIYFYS
jgi:hypothetical protein